MTSSALYCPNCGQHLTWTSDRIATCTACGITYPYQAVLAHPEDYLREQEAPPLPGELADDPQPEDEPC